ncbi:hypothetical protein INT48_002537 [Thamnidium elegans]|uniref:Uncharacterized protein n=1 Tax=Thamnidium elegans TaxID=101142 RepID=A0A8H7T0T5_9FUNG|nr:hypothetical protein INT48_002537 [Thamnidium elegans]
MQNTIQFSCCCNKPDCLKLEEFHDSYDKTENDALLAAEIGQILLQEENQDLRYELFKENYKELKQLRLENQRSNEMIKVLDIELKSKIKDYEESMIKNKLVKQLLTVKSEIEEELKTQISDLKQELSQLRKSETNMTVPQFKMTVTHEKNPFEVLQSVTQQTIDKINATDTRVLNRRLKRVFDMSELSDLSNSLLNNLLIDLSDFNHQFDWVHGYHDQAYFFPLAATIQSLLKEIGTIKMTLNDLQADYVKRIERLTIIQPMISAYKQQRHLSRLENEKKNFMQGLLSLFTLHSKHAC